MGSTIGSVAALIPGLDVVGFATAAFSAVTSLASAILNIGRPDPTMRALKELFSDISDRISLVNIQIQQTISHLNNEAAGIIIDQAAAPLQWLVSTWNATFGNSSKEDVQQVFYENVYPISNTVVAWNSLADCLAGMNIDCNLNGEKILDVMARDGQLWYRPVRLMQLIQHYSILLSNSATIICGWDLLRRKGDRRSGCPILPDFSKKLQQALNAMRDVAKKVVSQWKDEHGVPAVLKTIVESHATCDGEHPGWGNRQCFENQKSIVSRFYAEMQDYYIKDGVGKGALGLQ